jgi:hypothetical protein
MFLGPVSVMNNFDYSTFQKRQRINGPESVEQKHSISESISPRLTQAVQPHPSYQYVNQPLSSKYTMTCMHRSVLADITQFHVVVMATFITFKVNYASFATTCQLLEKKY